MLIPAQRSLLRSSQGVMAVSCHTSAASSKRSLSTTSRPVVLVPARGGAALPCRDTATTGPLNNTSIRFRARTSGRKSISVHQQEQTRFFARKSAGGADDGSNAPPPAATSPPPPAPEPVDPWKEVKDPAGSGKTYWWNTQTNQVTALGAAKPVPGADNQQLANAQNAQPPAVTRGGLMGAIADGMAFGLGSSLMHRAMDGIMGPRSVEVLQSFDQKVYDDYNHVDLRRAGINHSDSCLLFNSNSNNLFNSNKLDVLFSSISRFNKNYPFNYTTRHHYN
ncbi:unnamed protein product [Amoebophrya sp. A25]|nr:unnamed protein product [Amoebophrya sp. A25]|eukprot:GSA25T00006460001.1